MTAYGQISVTGTAAAPSLKLLTLGAVVPIGNLNSTITPGIPATLLSALTGIREAVGPRLLTPTDATGVTTSWTYPVIADRFDLTAEPGNAVVFLGSVANGSSSTPFRDISGALAIVSAGYLAPHRHLFLHNFCGNCYRHRRLGVTVLQARLRDSGVERQSNRRWLRTPSRSHFR